MIFPAHRQSDLHMFVIIVINVCFPSVKSNGRPYGVCMYSALRVAKENIMSNMYPIFRFSLDGVVGYHVGLILSV